MNTQNLFLSGNGFGNLDCNIISPIMSWLRFFFCNNNRRKRILIKKYIYKKIILKY